MYTTSAATLAKGIQVVLDTINDPGMEGFAPRLEEISELAFWNSRENAITALIEEMSEYGYYLNHESVFAVVEGLRHANNLH
jgi:hypothetical protein